MSFTPTDKDRADALNRSCVDRLAGHGLRTLASMAQELADEAARGGEPDHYGNGGVVAEVEEQVRVLFDAEAAILMPSGTLAQAVALRMHAAERGLATVAMHPSSHPLLHEEDALQELHGLQVEDVGAVRLLEIPRRETGGHVPTWDELVELSFACAAEGVALHLDGARLWQCGPWFAPHTLAEVVALADTTYLSLYKDLAGPAGAILLLPEDMATEARTWRHRAGGTLQALWPLALGARRGLRERLPRMPLYVQAAKALGAGLETTCPVEVSMLHAILPGDPQRFLDACIDLADETGVWLTGYVLEGPREGTVTVEIACGEATLALGTDRGLALLNEASSRAS